ncbi:MAG: hemolysin family protein [bacterium]
MNVPLLAYILFSFSFIALSAFVSGSKKSFFVLDQSEVRAMAEAEESPALRFLSQRPQETLLTLLILHQAIWILLVAVTVWSFQDLSARVMALILLFTVYLFFGRFLPRILVRGKEIRYIRLVSPFLKVLFFVVSPLRFIFDKVSSLLLREGWVREKPVIQDRDFKNLVEEPEDAHEMYEREMIQNVMDFRKTLVKEVITPRPDMFCIDVEEEVIRVVQKVRAASFSRIPVYAEDRDHIVGILYAKDLLPLVLKGVSAGQKLPDNLLHPAMHVPETKRISELLREFKKQNVHMAIVVDEYGGVEGLVCLEDLLEEIVGEIQDEGDVGEKLVEKVDEQTYRISAMLSLWDFNDLFHVEIESEDYETIGGFVVDQLGHFPKWGEKVIYGGLEISVYRLKDVRILELMVTNLDTGQENQNGPGGGE